MKLQIIMGEQGKMCEMVTHYTLDAAGPYITIDYKS